MAFKTYNEGQSFKDVNTGEVFTAKRITNASYTHYKNAGMKSEWNSFRKGNSVGSSNDTLGFVNPNTKNLSSFVKIGRSVTQTKKTNSNTPMKNLNLEMGPVKGDQFKLTVMGTVAIAVDGGHSSYNVETGELTDVTGFTLDMDGMFYNMPSPSAEPGDLLRVKGGYGYVVEVKKNTLKVMLLDGEIKTIKSTKSPFGFNFYTKVVSIMDMGGSGGGEGLFGDMNPMMLMMMSGNGNGTGGNSNPFGGGGDMMSMMMMSQMMGGSSEGGLGELFGGKSKKSKEDKKK